MGDMTVISNRADRRRDRYASRKEVAEYLGVPVATLTAWAYKRGGPAYKIIGKHARYAWADVDRWVESLESGGAA